MGLHHTHTPIKTRTGARPKKVEGPLKPFAPLVAPAASPDGVGLERRLELVLVELVLVELLMFELELESGKSGGSSLLSSSLLSSSLLSGVLVGRGLEEVELGVFGVRVMV